MDAPPTESHISALLLGKQNCRLPTIGKLADMPCKLLFREVCILLIRESGWWLSTCTVDLEKIHPKMFVVVIYSILCRSKLILLFFFLVRNTKGDVWQNVHAAFTVKLNAELCKAPRKVLPHRMSWCIKGPV